MSIMGSSIPTLLFLPILFLLFLNTNVRGCHEQEREALLKFKHGLYDPASKLSSWVGEDCCKWTGVGCKNTTGHVIMLDLRNININYFGYPLSNFSLGGKIDSSLIHLKHLKYLDLSRNNFSMIHIPKYFGSFEHLRYLNLSYANFTGKIPHQLGNLSNLHTLDLRLAFWHFNSVVDDLAWVSSLSFLQYLGLSSVNLTRALNWQQEINKVFALKELHLSGCMLGNIHSSFPFSNLTSINVLDLSANKFNSTLPHWLTNFNSLAYLDLSGNEFSGSIPSTMGNLTFLEFLDLSVNSIDGRIPKSFSNLCNLRILRLSTNSISRWERLTGCLANSLEALYVSENQLKESLQVWLGETSNLKNLKFLDLSFNLFSGFIPSSIGRLSSLQELHLASNKLGGYIPQSIGKLSNLLYLNIADNFCTFVITESLFTKVESLENINLALNNLVWKVNSQWLPPNILEINISSTRVGPKFPSWLQHHRSISWLSMSNSSISDVVPDWFGNITVNMEYLDLSHNQLQGKLPNSLLKILDVSNDSFSRPILEKNMPNLMWLDISNNFLNGSLPSLLCKLESLQYLDLSSNYLHGNILDCWGDKSMSIWYINFSNNSFSGEIPSSLSDIPFLASLHLRNNFLSGELPSSMKKMKYLVVLDIAHNKLSGVIPTWLGENLSSLRILSLRSNMIYGNIPPQISNSSSLQFLDLSHNNLSGAIPRSLGDFNAMTKMHYQDFTTFQGRGYYGFLDQVVMILKGVELENSGTLGFYNVIDLSVNNLSGDIPEELTRLLGLKSLNLSSNSLKGNIPNNIGALKELESLDLSKNRLFGEVPLSLSTLYSLSKLNLSYNNLSGRIPSGFQLQTLNDPSIYIGNDNLCGPPLSPCPTNEVPPHMEIEKEKDDEFEMIGFFVSIGLGIVIGFWGFCAVLIFKRSWRIAYYRFCDDIIEKVIVAMTIWFSRLKTNIQKVREN